MQLAETVDRNRSHVDIDQESRTHYRDHLMNSLQIVYYRLHVEYEVLVGEGRLRVGID